MSSERRTAAIVGVLFVTATGFFVAGQTLHGPFLSGPDALELAAPNGRRVLAGILVELIGVLAIPLIALCFYPILERVERTVALAYIGLRILEAAALVVVDANLWTMVSLSEAFHDGTRSVSVLETQLGMLQGMNESAFLISVAIIFPLGSCLLNAVLWRTRLLPRFISGWGVVGAALLLAGSILDFFSFPPRISPTLLGVVLPAPIALQEMVLATWLIAKGVTESQAHAGPAFNGD